MNKLKLFFMKFFENLKCDVHDNGDYIVVSEVPVKFEKFSGKKCPYKFCFDSEINGCEFVGQNHYLLKSMKEFLEGRGETTLLKMEVSFNPKEDIPDLISLINCKLKSVSKNYNYDFLFRFSFGTMFQYLNEREQIINNVYVRNGNVVNFDESFVFSEGNKRDVREVKIDGEYELAKSKLKEINNPKINELSVKLDEQLRREISRIKDHYKNHFDELSHEKESFLKQLTSVSEDKKAKIEGALRKIEEEGKLNKLKEEEEHFIKHEIRKHALNIKNKILNVSIIYFPVFSCNLVLNAGNEDRIVNVSYDPVDKGLSSLFCNSCNSKIDEIILCSSGHLTCKNCGNHCGSCSGVSCNSCVKLSCGFCDKSLCSACSVVCGGCKKSFCNSHVHDFKGTDKKLCRDCLKRCSSCGDIIDSDSGNIMGRIYCLKCYNRETGKKILEEVFER